MASTTPNIGLTLPVGTEKRSRAIWNNNFTILDTKIGAVGNTSLQAQVTALNSQIASDWTGCADYKETIESSANVVLQSFGKMRMLTFQGATRTHTEDEVLMTLPATHRPLASNNIFAAGSIGSTPVTVRLNGSDGRVTLFIANGATENARLYFQMVWVAA